MKKSKTPVVIGRDLNILLSQQGKIKMATSAVPSKKKYSRKKMKRVEW